MSGWLCLIENATHPFRITAFSEGKRTNLLVYIWTLTHGGGARRPRDEFRIQLTGILPPLERPADTVTLLLGWHEQASVFAGFDVQRHRSFSTRSPSVQIRFGAIEHASEIGISVHRKSNAEIAVAFTPEFFMDYAARHAELHGFAAHQQDLQILNEAVAAREATEADLGRVAGPRRRVIRTLAMRSRAVDFRKRVIEAYRQRCAICELQLELIEAAHIVPVEHPGSNDLTSNGISLCALHHRAYDNGLVAVAEDYRVLMSASATGRLDELSLDGGLESFRADLRNIILLPSSPAIRPNPDYLRIGMECRGWRP